MKIFLTMLFALIATMANATIIQPVGYFVMQPLHGNNPELSNNVISSPKLSGVHIREKWSLLEPNKTTNSFTWLDQQINRAKSLGKQVTLGIYEGTNSPNWVTTKRVNGAPLPWDTNTVDAHLAMVAALGQHFNGNPTISAVHISSPASYESMEMHLSSGMYNNSGYSDAKIIDVWKKSIDAYAKAFTNVALVLDVAMVPNSRGAVTNAVIDYAQAKLGEQINFIHCSLKASTSLTAPHHLAVVNAHKEGSRIGFEMVGPSSDRSRFGGTFAQAINIGNTAGASWYQIYQGDIQYIPNKTLGNIPEPKTYLLLLCLILIVLGIRKR
jgi:hypothetical protein